jgi:hypothetical protein
MDWKGGLQKPKEIKNSLRALFYPEFRRRRGGYFTIDFCRGERYHSSAVTITHFQRPHELTPDGKSWPSKRINGRRHACRDG